MSNVANVTDNTFAEMVLEASKTKPVFVDFWADWCTPCKAFSPVVDQVAEEMGDKMSFLKMDTDANPNIASNMDILAIPTFMVFKDGALVLRDAGFKPRDVLVEMLSKVLSGQNTETSVPSAA